MGSVVVNGCCRVPEGFGSRTNSGMPLVYLLLINHIEQLIYALMFVGGPCFYLCENDTFFQSGATSAEMARGAT